MTKKQVAREWIIFLIAILLGLTIVPQIVGILIDFVPFWSISSFYDELLDYGGEAWIVLISPYAFTQFIRSILWSVRVMRKDHITS